MVRFILNFIFFGVLFYAIYLFFPDAFKTLVVWAKHVYDFIAEVLVGAVHWVDNIRKSGAAKIDSANTLSTLIHLPFLIGR